MFRCGFPNHHIDVRMKDKVFAGFKELDIRAIQNYGPDADAPHWIQLNWDEIVLWRRLLRYPKPGED